MKWLYKIMTMFICTIWMLSSFAEVYAANGNITYVGGAEKFIFAPGTEESPTDLFPDLKGVIPGDTITQEIVIKNKAKTKNDIKVYLRSQGSDEDTQEFLSQMHLKVETEDGKVLSDKTADKPMGMESWKPLGLIPVGEERSLIVTLEVPVTMTDEFQNQIGSVKWEFKVEEFPKEGKPVTADNYRIFLFIALLVVSMIYVIVLSNRQKRNRFD